MRSSISSKKRTKTSRILVKTNSFVCFLEEIHDPPNHFEITWPLRRLNKFIWTATPTLKTQQPNCNCILCTNSKKISLYIVKLEQETCAKCFAVHISKFEILQSTWKSKTKKNIKKLDLLMKNWKSRVWCSLFHLFHMICKISNFNSISRKLLVLSWL